MTLTLDIPPDIEAAKRERLAVALYDARAVSQGRAAQIAGLSRDAFIDALGRYGVTPFQYEGLDDLWSDLETLAERDAAPAEVVQGSPEWTAHNHRLCLARQNSIEFRGVASRPVAVNGLGMTPGQADAELDVIEGLVPRLPERAQGRVYDVWRDLCRQADVSGKQVHDTRLVAVCAVAGVETILTWNAGDFRRFIPLVPGLIVLTPADVLAAP